MYQSPAEYPKCLYHPKHAPLGRVFQNSLETKGLSKKGWVDNPGKFPKPWKFTSKLRNLKPWWEEWKWAFQAAGVILGLIAAAITLYKVFRH
jgi:hypothetical protein